MNRKAPAAIAGIAMAAVFVPVGLTGTAVAGVGEAPCGPSRTIVRHPAVVHERRVIDVAAVEGTSHEEYRWARFHRNFVPEVPEQSHTEWQWQRKVVTQEYRPPVPGTEEQGHYVQGELITEEYDEVTGYAYVHTVPGHPGSPRYESDENWNAESNPNSTGWLRAPDLDQVTHHDAVYGPARWVPTQEATDGSPEIPEEFYYEHTYSVESPGEDWKKGTESKDVVDSPAEEAYYTDWKSYGSTEWSTDSTKPDGTGLVSYRFGQVRTVVDTPAAEEVSHLETVVDEKAFTETVIADQPCPDTTTPTAAAGKRVDRASGVLPNTGGPGLLTGLAGLAAIALGGSSLRRK